MEEKKSERFEQLRREAEKKLDKAIEKTEHISEEETLSIKELIHELQVHQIELELQNQDLRETKARLHRSKEKYTDLYDSAPISYLTLDEDGKILSANLTAAESLCKERDELEGEKLYRYIKEDHRDRLYKHLRDAFKSEEHKTCELKIISDSNTSPSQEESENQRVEFYGLLRSRVYTDDEDNLLCRTALIDITERKEAKKKMQESEGKYRRLFETAQDGILIIDAEAGKIVDANPFIK
ncbi:MAG: PAS domain-containing protein, partial [Thermoplasmata archaeon]